ncbi:MAG: YbjN domain-containing protein [Aristaeellaceae bacterium]
MTQQERLIQRTKEYLTSRGWPVDPVDDEENVFELNMRIRSALKTCQVFIIVTDEEIMSMAVAPYRVEKEFAADVVEFITRANLGLRIGKFEYDYDEGEVRYQSCLPCSEGVPAMADVARVIDLPVMMLERCGDALFRNMTGQGDPASDAAEMEG